MPLKLVTPEDYERVKAHVERMAQHARLEGARRVEQAALRQFAHRARQLLFELKLHLDAGLIPALPEPLARALTTADNADDALEKCEVETEKIELEVEGVKPW